MSIEKVKRRCKTRPRFFLMISIVAIVAMFSLGWLVLNHYRNLDDTQFSGIASDEGSNQKWYSFDKHSQLSSSNHSGRPVFPYSVIEGGVRNVHELRNAIAQDKIVAAHYADFNLARAQIVQLRTAKAAYVSYRVKNTVFWTKKKIRVAKGERLITDGNNYLRTRCGNRMSEVEHAAISPNEPTQEVLDTPLTMQVAFQPNSGTVGLVPSYPLPLPGGVLVGGTVLPTPVRPPGPGGSLGGPPPPGGGGTILPPNSPPGTPPQTPGGSTPPPPPANGGSPPPSSPPSAPPPSPGNTPPGSGPPNTPPPPPPPGGGNSGTPTTPPTGQPSPPTPPTTVEITPPPPIVVETPPPVIIPPPGSEQVTPPTPPAPVPEPSTLLLLSSGLGSYLIYRKKSKKVR